MNFPKKLRDFHANIAKRRRMEGRRISAAHPRPCSGKRVVASKKRPRVDGSVNTAKKLLRREICSRQHRSFSTSNAQERFRHMRLMEEYDTQDPKGNEWWHLPFFMDRTKVVQIVAVRDIVFALAHSGVCAAFSRETNRRICFLNVSRHEVIRRLIYNKINDSLITYSRHASDNFGVLKCRSTKIEYIRMGKPDAGFVNEKALPYYAQDSPGIILLVFNRASSHVRLKILSIEDGTVLEDFHLQLHRDKQIHFIFMFNDRLLVKQEGANLQILDLRSGQMIKVSMNEFMTPCTIIFLYKNQLFLTFRDRTVAVCNFRGELVTFEDHLLFHPDCYTECTCITSNQDLIISYCKAKLDDHWNEGNAGSINISNILTGKCLAKISAANGNRSRQESGTTAGSSEQCHSHVRCTVAEALEDITVLYYNEDRNEIYTGNGHGLVHVWAN